MTYLERLTAKTYAWHKLIDKCPAVMRSKAFADLILEPDDTYIHVKLDGFMSHKEPIKEFPSDETIGKLWLLAR